MAHGHTKTAQNVGLLFYNCSKRKPVIPCIFLLLAVITTKLLIVSIDHNIIYFIYNLHYTEASSNFVLTVTRHALFTGT